MKIILTYILARLRNEACMILVKLFNLSLEGALDSPLIRVFQIQSKEFSLFCKNKGINNKGKRLTHLIRVRENDIGMYLWELVRITLRDLTNYVLIFPRQVGSFGVLPNTLYR